MRFLTLLAVIGCGLDPVNELEKNSDTDDGIPDDAIMLGELALSPSTVDFETLLIGQSATEEILFINTGNIPLNVASVYIEGSNSFSLSTSIVSFDIEPGAQEITEVEFTPTDESEATGTLNVLVSSESSIGQVDLIGVGSIDEVVEPDTGDTEEPEDMGLTIEKTSHDFGLISLNSTATITIPMKNDSPDPVMITNITSTDNAFGVSDFSDVAVGETFSPNVNRAVTLTFTPTDEMPYQGDVTIETDSAITPSLTVSLAGEGNCSNCVPAIYVFHNGNNASTLNSFTVLGGLPAVETVQVQNNGTEPLIISSMDLVDSMNPPDLFCGEVGVFSIGGTTSGTLGPGDTVQFTVTLSYVDPNGLMGGLCGIDESANSITINSNDPNNPNYVLNLGGAIIGLGQ